MIPRLYPHTREHTSIRQAVCLTFPKGTSELNEDVRYDLEGEGLSLEVQAAVTGARGNKLRYWLI
jgi:hypothetical protein